MQWILCKTHFSSNKMFIIAEREVSAVRYAEEGGKANGAYIGDSTKM